MKKEVIDFLTEVKEIAADFAKKYTKLAEIIGILVGDEKPAKAIEAKPTKVEEPKVEKKEVTLEDVRTKLAGLSRNGHTKEVKELLQKYGAEKLSAVKPEDYEALLADAEEIGNA